jgi:pimeloyl-ACP methyl ester carboxylesterase
MTDGPRTPGTERRIDANGVTLAVTEYPATGQPPVVLLHGIGSRGVSWWPVIDDLAAHFHLHAVDLRGHGASAKPAAGYDLTDYAADLTAILAVLGLGLERPRLIGHSLGSLVTLAWLRENPAGAAAAILEDPPLRVGPEVLAALDGWLALSRLPVEQAAAYYRAQNPHWSEDDCRRRAESITATAPAVFNERRADAEHLLASGEDRLATIRALTTPTLLVHGDRAAGSMVEPADAARLAATFPAVRLAHIPGAGHGIHRDQSAAFLGAVVPFLRDAE